MYSLEFLQVAKEDMIDIVHYISHQLLNPTAAEGLATEMIEAANKLRNFPYKNRTYETIRKLKREYRGQMVGSYIMFYCVDEEKKLITIARVIYARRDYSKLLV